MKIAKSISELVLALSKKNEQVHYKYKEGTEMAFEKNGDVSIEDEQSDYTIKYGSTAFTDIQFFVKAVHKAEVELSSYLSFIPKAILRNMGDEEGLAKSLFDVALARIYYDCGT